jgi:uncharacterized protein with gpF-like domain
VPPPLALRTRRERLLPPVRPSYALEMAYRRRLDALITEMHRSLVYWLGAAYKQNKPEIAQDIPFYTDALAMDDSPAATLRTVFRRLARRWQRRFDDLAGDLARYFATQTAQRSAAALQAMLKKGGMSVRFKMTRPVNDVVMAQVGENVALIRSIAQEHLAAVEGHVMRSVQTGRDLGTLAAALEHQYGVTKKRAALIARDQSNKATANIVRARQMELGIDRAQWVHSHAGKEPRPSHVKAGRDRIQYFVKDGWWDPDEGKFIHPGELVNCRCVSRSIVEGFS